VKPRRGFVAMKVSLHRGEIRGRESARIGQVMASFCRVRAGIAIRKYSGMGDGMTDA
jgi:hypothetical protein